MASRREPFRVLLASDGIQHSAYELQHSIQSEQADNGRGRGLRYLVGFGSTGVKDGVIGTSEAEEKRASKRRD